MMFADDEDEVEDGAEFVDCFLSTPTTQDLFNHAIHGTSSRGIVTSPGAAEGVFGQVTMPIRVEGVRVLFPHSEKK
jgi:hypothetical protein